MKPILALQAALGRPLRCFWGRSATALDQMQRRVNVAFVGDAVRQLNLAEASGNAELVLRSREYLRRSIEKLQASAGLTPNPQEKV
jgi:hypothetical protein